MSLSSARSKLHESGKVLLARWEETRDGWNDAAGRQFEADHFEPIAPAVQAALRAVDRLAVVLTQMRNECD